MSSCLQRKGGKEARVEGGGGVFWGGRGEGGKCKEVAAMLWCVAFDPCSHCRYSNDVAVVTCSVDVAFMQHCC